MLLIYGLIIFMNTIDLKNIENAKVQIFDINGHRIYESFHLTSKKIVTNVKNK